jgi:predicted lipase
MRDHSLRRLIVLAGCLTASVALAADSGAASVRIEAPDTLRAGERTSVGVQVELPASVAEDAPLLLTPTVEGAAVEVLRGRLFRADAKRTGPRTLSFQIPVIAQREGAAILRVDFDTYACQTRCSTLHVGPR